MSEPQRSGSGSHRSGVVAILGRPNAGKSTLLNRMLGEKLAIVTRKPQTTRSRILGILSRENAQLLLLDTPGFHESPKALNRTLNEIVDEAADDCDVALLLVDPGAGWDEGHDALRARLEKRGVPVVVAATKCDRPELRERPWPPTGASGAAACLRVSGTTGEGVDALVETLVSLLPEGPRYYEGDELTDRPVRFLVAELIREAAFENLRREVPYSLAVSIEAFDESRPDLFRIRANLLVERASQKGIVLGQGGVMIKRIGSEARRRIEALLETRVHLELWVKVDPDWARRPKQLEALGYR